MTRSVIGDNWFAKQTVFGVPFHVCDTQQACYFLAIQAPDAEFNYVVTPNVDHLVRLHRDHDRLAPLYEGSLLTTCDSRIAAVLAWLAGKKLSVGPGSDIARVLFDHVIDPDEPVTIIGGSDETIRALARRYGLRRINACNPPMGFINSEAEIRRCVAFVEAHPARFHFFAVGSPQQEILARRIKDSGRAVGSGVCVGSGIDFVAGVKPRAPAWVRMLALEWLYRLATEPRRLWRRYLVDGLGIFPLWAKEIKGQIKGRLAEGEAMRGLAAHVPMARPRRRRIR